MNNIDVVIPVYKGLDETENCIKSVIKSRNDMFFNIIIINDDSPDENMQSMLEKYAGLYNITLLVNKNNLGFTGTVNRGMRINLDHDIILLNSDTIVPDLWVDKISRAIESNKRIGTLTVLSNRATICSLPQTNFDNDLPTEYSLNEINSICEKVNQGVVIDIPTAVGFCMFIKREAISDVGYFDEEKWGKGYCEENDFSIRVETMGWRNVALCDTFVEHLGSVSFSGEKQARIDENLRLLRKLYPDFLPRVHNFIRYDPLKKARSRINIKLFSKMYSQFFLHISHSWGGGIEKFIQSYENGKNGNLVLRGNDGQYATIELLGHGVILEYPKDFSLDDIISDLSGFNVVVIHYHQFIGLPLNVISLAKKMSIPSVYTIHDFYTACPRANFVNNKGVFCGQIRVHKICDECLNDKVNPVNGVVEKELKEVGGIANWRNTFKNFLININRIESPSYDSAIRLKRYFQDINPKIIPHEDASAFPKRIKSTIKNRVAIIGAIGDHKGYRLLCELVEYVNAKSIDLTFVIIGYTKNDEYFSVYDNVTITGKYSDSELPILIKNNNVDKALFLSIWPETYSYTLSEALLNNLLPITLDIGAIPERLGKLNMGIFLPMGTSIDKIVEKCIE